jgi:hypothetical protein
MAKAKRRKARPSTTVTQPDDLGEMPRLNDVLTSRRKLRMGHNKWDREQHKIAHVRIGRRKFYTDQALVDYVEEHTRPASPKDAAEAKRSPSSRQRGEHRSSAAD